MKIAVASGKGGTGKTTVSVNLARVFKRDVLLADCDVEEPNAHLFLKTSDQSEKIVGIPVPEVNEDLCNCCGDCAKICQFSAIVTFGTTPLVFRKCATAAADVHWYVPLKPSENKTAASVSLKHRSPGT